MGYGQKDEMKEFYSAHLDEASYDNQTLIARCPFCEARGKGSGERQLVVYLNRKSFFYGFFRCLNRCVSGGFPPWFARLYKLDKNLIPEYDTDREPVGVERDYPAANVNADVRQYNDQLHSSFLEYYVNAGITRATLDELKIGFNGRYLVYPYVCFDGNSYSARCIYPGRKEDFFWHGDPVFAEEQAPLFNEEDIERAENGAIFICEGEENLLVVKQLGFPAVATASIGGFDSIDTELFVHIKTVFLVVANNTESRAAGRRLAERIGYKVRLLPWPSGTEKNYSLWQLAVEKGKAFKDDVLKMVAEAKPFSPFPSNEMEYANFITRVHMEGGEQFSSLLSGFPRLDHRLDGMHGINVVGGSPKVGKSTFMIQIASEMSRREIPVLYYDFENGRQKIYQRILARLSRLSMEEMRDGEFDHGAADRFVAANDSLKDMLRYLRVINDRKISPEIMRKHIDFIRHETRSDYTVVIVDSLHKLPFTDFNERRTGIDAWLRQMESIRDELQVSFIIISELTRGDGGSYEEKPHMGMFKGSGDIEYTADNALIFQTIDEGEAVGEEGASSAVRRLHLVASREHSPGVVGDYRVDYPFWGFSEEG